MLSRAMTRRTLTLCSDAGNDRLGRELEPCGEVDARLVALLDRLAENDADRLRDVVHAGGRACGDVERASARAGLSRRTNRGVDDVADVREVTRLLAVAIDCDRLSLVDGRDEERYDRRVLRVRALPRTEHVEVSEDDCREGGVHAAEAEAVAL